MRIVTIIFLFFTTTAFSSFEMNNRMKRTHSYILNLEFSNAMELLKLEEFENSKNRIIILHENYIDFLTIIIGEERETFVKAKLSKSNRLNSLKSGDRDSPYYLYSQAEFHLQWAFCYLKFDQYAIAIYEFILAYNLFIRNQEDFPDFKLNKKGLGVIYTLLSAVPDQFSWMLDIAGLKGDIKLGLSELDVVLNDSKLKLYKDEVLFMISFLQMNMNNNSSICYKYLNMIGEDYKEQILLTYTAARISHYLGLNDYCIKVLESRPSNKNRYPFYYLDYLQGMSYLYKLDYVNSKKHLNIFVENFKGNNYIKSSYHKLAWISYLENNDKKYEYLMMVIDEGVNVIDEDKVALKDANNLYFSDPFLLKSRLLFDGGYYESSLNEINQTTDFNVAEYHYRLARIMSKLNYESSDIISSYINACDLGNYTSDYYAPMSALQIGLIYELNNDTIQARLYFEKCLKFSGFDYERGIHIKADAAIERISR